MSRKRIIRTWPMPKGCEAKTVSMREMDKADELAAAVSADIRMRTLPADQQRSAMIALHLERDEAIRQGLYKIDGRRVNLDGVPCVEIDGWSPKSWTALQAFHADLNGVPGDELGNCQKAATDEYEESDGAAPSPAVAAAGK